MTSSVIFRATRTRTAVLHERGKSAGKLGEEIQPRSVADNGRIHFPAVPGDTAPCRLDIPAEEHDDRKNTDQDGPPEVFEKGGAIQKAGRGRQGSIHALKNFHEFGHHESHEKEDDAQTDDDDDGRVDHGALELALDLCEALIVRGEAFQNFYQRAALFARADHVHKHVGENDRLAAHGLREAFALDDVLLELAADLGRDAFAADIGHTVEGGRERHTGSEEIGQLVGIVGELLHAGLFLAGEVIPCALRQEVEEAA